MKTLIGIRSVFVKAAGFFAVMMVLCGVVYPLFITGVSRVFFGEESTGSIIEADGVKYGSALLAQEFTSDQYLWGRIMNVDTSVYVGADGEPLAYAGPSNKSPAGEELKALVAERVERLKIAYPEKGDEPIPMDLVTCSGSGLDPHISPEAAHYQSERIARARGLEVSQVEAVIDRYTSGKFLGFFGEETVNVLEVNLALDGILKDD